MASWPGNEERTLALRGKRATTVSEQQAFRLRGPPKPWRGRPVLRVNGANGARRASQRRDINVGRCGQPYDNVDIDLRLREPRSRRLGASHRGSAKALKPAPHSP